MAHQLPAKLKIPQIQPFALRAAQLETVKPVIAYWCEYWIANHILAKGLHHADTECLQYTTKLMDKLEQTKARHATNDAIVDDTAGQAYVEQFGLETFERADRAVKANKVTKQTIDTFVAASTFLELINIWGEPDPEIHAKIRYAKWNAVRIAKALKEGKDPNESNPKPEPTPEENMQPLDPNDPEVQLLGGQPTKPRHASVEEVPDEQDRIESRLAAQSILDRSLHPSTQPSARASPGIPEKFNPFPQSGIPYNAVSEHDVSPLEPPGPDDPISNAPTNSMGSGYFPNIPTFTSDPQPSTLRTAPANSITDTDDISPPDLLEAGPPLSGPIVPGKFDSLLASKAGDESSRQPQSFYKPIPPQQRQLYIPRQEPSLAFAPPPTSISVPTQPFKQQTYIADDAAIAKAQKHARFAISALTFDDPDTAIKELKAALQTLGAQ